MSRTVYFETYGCQMNEHDTTRMAEKLQSHGFSRTSTIEQADLVLINTCSVRELAVQKAYSQIGRMRELKEQRATKLAVTGCVAQLEGEALLKRFEVIDLVLGPDNIYQVGELVERVFSGERLVKAELDESPSFQFLTAEQVLTAEQGTRSKRIQAFVTVQKGCDKNCSYCIVPKVRGKEVSRPLDEIVQEVEQLVSTGVREITLLGQNIDAYRDPTGHRFHDLLRAVSLVPDLYRLRFTTGHPNDFSEAMADVMAQQQTICEHLHLPVQSGSDVILKKMYRGYTVKRYLEKIQMVRNKIPDLALTTDIIVGFPGETEADFEQTLRLVEEVQYDSAFCYSYSVRPGTPAQFIQETVSEEDKRLRLQRLLDVVRQTALKRTGRFIGRTMDVLVEGPSRTNPHNLTGRIRHNTVVNFATEGRIIEPGTLVQVEMLSSTNGFSLMGRLI